MSTSGAARAASPWRGSPETAWRPGVAAVASPMWQAVEWDNQVLAGELVFLKTLSTELESLVDVEAAAAGARAGATLGIAPPVLWESTAHKAIAFTWLPAPWRGARLDDLQRPAVMQAAIAAKKKLRRAPRLSRCWDVFAQIAFWRAKAEASGTKLPSDMPALLAAASQAEAGIKAAGIDLAPCHNDGQASNLLLEPDGQVLLCDFDCAGQSDPYYDLAVLLNEAYAFVTDWRTGLEMHDGTCRPSLLKRCRLYGVADDLLWGLTGLVLSHISSRRWLEFLKYGEWRLLRARMALRDTTLFEDLHKL